MRDFGIFILLLFVAFWVFRKDRKHAYGISKHHIDTRNFPLKKGKKGQEVLSVRIWLNQNYQVPYIESTVFDEDLELELQRILKRDNVSCAYYTKNKMYQNTQHGIS